MQTAMSRTQSRSGVSIGLQRVREVARKDKHARFTALLHHVTIELLRESFYALKRRPPPGVDGLTWQQYEEGLEDRMADLHGGCIEAATTRSRATGVHSQGRRTNASAGHCGAGGQDRPASGDDAAEPIYEAHFLGFSYGFRPGRGPQSAWMRCGWGSWARKVDWVLDADIHAFFDTIDHGWMLKFIEHRIGDPSDPAADEVAEGRRVEEGKWSKTEEGTPQGRYLTAAGERVPALRRGPVGASMARTHATGK